MVGVNTETGLVLTVMKMHKVSSLDLAGEAPSWRSQETHTNIYSIAAHRCQTGTAPNCYGPRIDTFLYRTYSAMAHSKKAHKPKPVEYSR